jgi:hypothetical protein
LATVRDEASSSVRSWNQKSRSSGAELGVLDVPDDPAAQIRADLDPPGFAVFRVFLDQEVVALAIGVELLVDLDDDPADREGPGARLKVTHPQLG